MVKKLLGNGSVYENKVGKYSYWYFEIRYIDENGKKRKKNIRGSSKSDARKKGNAFIEEFKSKMSPYSLYRLDEIFEKVIENKRIYSDIRPQSLITLTGAYDNHVRKVLGHFFMADLTSIAIQSLIDDVCRKSKSDSLPKKVLSAIKQCWDFYMNNAYVDNDIMRSVEINHRLIASSENKERFFTPEETRSIYCSAKEYANNATTQKKKLAYATVLLLNTGMRAGELQALEWSNVDFDKRLIYIEKTVVENSYDENGKKTTKPIVQDSPKTKSGVRAVYLNQQAIEALEELKKHFGHTPYVIASATGGIVRQGLLRDSFMDIVKIAGIKADKSVTLHTLRHCFATDLYHKNIDGTDYSIVMGHSNPATTLGIYIHNREAKALDDLKNNKLFN